MGHFLYFYRIYTKYLSGGVWWLMAVTIFVAFADGVGISMLLPLLQSLDMNEQVSQDNLLMKFTETLGVSKSLSGILSLMFVIFFCKAMLKFGAGYFRSDMFKNLYRYLKLQFYDGVLNVDYQYFTKKNTGHFITVMEGHVNRTVRSFDLFVNLVTAGVMAISYLIIAGLISWEVSAMAVVLGGIVFLVLSLVNRIVRNLSQSISTEEKHMNQIAVQALHAFKYIVSTSSFMPIKKQYEDSIRRLTQMQFKTKLAGAFTASIQELMAVSLLIAMIIIEVVVLGYPIAAVFVVLLLFYRGVNQIMAVQTNWQELVSLQGYVESVDEEFSALNQFKVKDGSQQLVGSLNAHHIEFDGVSFKYADSENDVINELSIKIQPNTTVAIVGASGSGKTTLVDLLTGLLVAKSGDIIIGDKLFLRDTKLSDWRSRIGYVAQDLTIFDDTVANNISLFENLANENAIYEAARMASAHIFIKELPDGYQTRIGDKGVRLSGGQKQRLFIARELYKQPELLILDEATSALDSESERYIQDSIDKLKGKITVILIAHRLSTIRNADVIYVLDQGTVVEVGDYEYLLSNQDSRFARMVSLQSF